MNRSTTQTGMVGIAPDAQQDQRKGVTLRPTRRIYPEVLARLLAEPDAACPDLRNRACRGCGCTDEDCRGCIERTGEPCFWIGDDLCSACAGKEGTP